jgi:uncharacterized protein
VPILETNTLYHATVVIAWIITGGLMLAGFIGCLIPVLPGHFIIILAAIAHRLMLGESSGLPWWSFFILGLLFIASQVVEFMSGAAGSKLFGGSRWGSFGAIIGSLVGLFFFPLGLLIGPLVGAILCEQIFAKKNIKPATASGLGSVVGTIGGMIIKIAFGIVMIAWILVDILWFK